MLLLGLLPGVMPGLAACQGVPGDDPSAYGTQRYVDAEQTFSVDFLSPPWEVAQEDGETLELEVASELLGVALDGTPPSHGFLVGHIDLAQTLAELVEEEAQERELDVPDPEALPELPDYLAGIDLQDPYTVGLAELNYLLDEQNAELDHEVSAFLPDSGIGAVEFQVQMSPGIFVRAFYFDARPTVVRATFISGFDLDTGDVEHMARTVDTTPWEAR